MAGWPRHGYAEEADWQSVGGTLELRGWPAVEYRAGRVVATDAATVFILSEGKMRTKGPSTTGLR